MRYLIELAYQSMFADRDTAGKLLGRAIQEALRQRPDKTPARTIVVAVSRGGAIVAREVAAKLCATMTIISSKIITAPSAMDTQLAVVNSRGTVVNTDDYDDSIEGLPSYLRNQQMQLAKLAKTLEDHWITAAGVDRPTMPGRKIIIVNDVITDGLVELAALRSIRPDKPRLMLVGSPVVSLAAERLLKRECDGLISLSTCADPRTAIQNYQKYDHVTDEMMTSALKTANRPSGSLSQS